MLSPTVLVRPIPDCDEATAQHSLGSLPDPIKLRNPEFKKLLGLAIKNLNLVSQKSTIAGRLARILATEFEISNSDIPEALSEQYAGTPFKHNVLTSLTGKSWTDPTFQEVVFFRAGEHKRVSTAPICEKCNSLLTRGRAESFSISGEEVRLECKSCGATNHHSLDKFFICTHQNKAFVWIDRENPFMASRHALPPPAQFEANDVVFEWNPVAVGGELERRFIRINLGTLDIEKITWSQVTYPKILAPVSIDEFQGLPIRHKYWEALSPTVEGITSRVGNVTYEGIKLRGIPFSFPYEYTSNSFHEEKQMQIGVFPRRMYADWAKYRCFIAGNAETLAKYKVLPPSEDRLSPTICDFSAESKSQCKWPRFVSVEDHKSNIGATWDLDLVFPGSQSQEAPQQFFVGLDFGTTSSVVFGGWRDEGTEIGLRPSLIRDACVWIPTKDRKFQNDFLPDWEEPESQDPLLIPSAIWKAPAGHKALIRWREKPPNPDWQATHGFKWDNTHAGQRFSERRCYLEELLFLAIPSFMCRFGSMAPPNLSLGVAYPLAFSAESVRNYHQLTNKVLDSFAELSGVKTRPQRWSLSESQACVNALGREEGQTFLVADMGGGTLDIALFQIDNKNNPDYKQVGSFRFGGEAFVNAFQKQTREDEWSIRDAIWQNKVGTRYPGDQRFGRLLRKFLPLSVEVLRILLAAFKHEEPETKVIRVALVGNGWRLCELSNREARSPRDALKEHLGEWIE
ncbi:MAG TPA: hypothetical protein VNI77_06350, partial [Nitrososphaera sp.]|nr:hypothetical protein [Nitrososphaera sp.]